MDRWDFVGAAALLFVAGGVFGLVGASWASIAMGLELMGVYVLVELKKRRNS